MGGEGVNDTRAARADFDNLRRGVLRGLFLTIVSGWLLYWLVGHFNF